MSWAWRIYEDFLMGSRLGAYEKMLRALVDDGYEFLTFARFWEEVKRGVVHNRCVLLRHDIDSDAKTAQLMWDIERSLGVVSSFYFRLSTIDLHLIGEIAHSGFEVSYHYEELSTYARRHKIHTASAIRARFPEIQLTFEENLRQLRQRTGLAMRTVAAHGDFVNRRLGVRNTEILQDADFRRRVNVDLELYDERLTDLISSRHADLGAWKDIWAPVQPMTTAGKERSVLYVLVHPKHWRSSWRENSKQAAVRFIQGAQYWASRPRAH